ncbi:MAG: hypothetical protein CFE41_17320 [Burkholderiales bacterium PBB2]|nr:MAG: hypothetical protein CFE41_17320 [Burkholderiales bacterium PBB2]
MTRVKIVFPFNGELPRGWAINDIGYIRTAKLTLSSAAIKDALLLTKPSLNGLGGHVGKNGKTVDDVLWEEVAMNMKYWDAIEGVLDLCMSRETNAEKWGPRVKKLGALQILGGVAMIGLGAAALFFSGGLAAPLLVAFGYVALSTTAIGIGTSCAKEKLLAGSGLVGDSGGSTLSVMTTGGKETATVAGVTAAKKFALTPVVGSLGGDAAAVAVTSTGLGIGGGVIAVHGGASGIKVANKVNPIAAWNAVDWLEIMKSLTTDYIKLREELENRPNRSEADLKGCAALHDPVNILKPAMQKLDKLIGKVAAALIESKNWNKGHAARKHVAPI